MAYLMCCTCVLPSCCQSTGSPADKSSVQWPYQSVSLLGLTNNTFFNFITGNSVLIIIPLTLVLLLLLVPIYAHFHSYFTQTNLCISITSLY